MINRKYARRRGKYTGFLMLFCVLFLCACGGQKEERIDIVGETLAGDEIPLDIEGTGDGDAAVAGGDMTDGTGDGNVTGGATGGSDAAGGGSDDVPDGATEETAEEPDLHPFDITLTFAGDISFAEDSPVMQKYFRENEDLTAVIDPEFIRIMKDADLMWINNEFTYSERGKALPGKAYTFRADPARVEMLHELGVDVAGLANNHVYDFGEDALYDTLSTLEDAGIPYVGAGHDLAEASRPLYMTVDGKTIAFVAASRAEKNKMTPQATEDAPGILRCYDTELFLQEIREAAENSDFCIALVHWGTEYSTDLEKVQLTTGKEYLDAGADAIVGGHSHCLQGFEFYEGKPIVYSLGNFWFNGKSLDTMLITLHIYGDDEGSDMEVIITPGLQANCVTKMVEGEDARALYDRLEEISINVQIGDDGVVRPE